MAASLAAVVVGSGGSAVAVFRRYRLSPFARGRRSARGKNGGDRHFRSGRVCGPSFTCVPRAPRSRVRTVSEGNGSGGDHDRRGGTGPGTQRGRGGAGVSFVARGSRRGL